MKGKILHLMVTILIAALLLSGCTGIQSALDRYYDALMMGTATAFEDMEYVRPDLTQFRQALDTAMDQAETEDDVDTLMESVYQVYTLYYDFSTQYTLANIRYCQDMTDIYWEQEYSWCMEHSSEISAGLDQLLYALADSPLRQELEGDDFFGQDFFDDYEGDSLWDDTFTALMEAEAALVDRYYDLNAQSLELEYYSQEYFDGIGAEIEQVFVDLIRVRQQIAQYAGYDSYPDFAYEFYFYRDYTPEQAQAYLEDVRQELVPLYQQLDSSVWDPAYTACTEAEVFAYVEECAQALGGVAADAFDLMDELELYDIRYSEKKYNASFEVYLYSYYSPFVFLCPQGTQLDQLTFVHEFGHFCNDYAAGGTMVGIDVAEVFSQGLEYLSLEYCEDTDALTRMKMADSLCVFVEQAAYASFEQQVYSLEADQLTVENVRAISQQVGEDFGLTQPGRDPRDYTLVPHYFISPMYVISYVISNDGAMQIYQMELEESGTGAKLWEDSLYTTEAGYLAFAQEVGLESPFADGRVAGIRKTLEEKLK